MKIIDLLVWNLLSFFFGGGGGGGGGRGKGDVYVWMRVELYGGFSLLALSLHVFTVYDLVVAR